MIVLRAIRQPHANYPSERSRPAPVVAIPRGRCSSCKGAPQPCALCRSDWEHKRCRCFVGDSPFPHAVDCPRFEAR